MIENKNGFFDKMRLSAASQSNIKKGPNRRSSLLSKAMMEAERTRTMKAKVEDMNKKVKKQERWQLKIEQHDNLSSDDERKKKPLSDLSSSDSDDDSTSPLHSSMRNPLATRS